MESTEIISESTNSEMAPVASGAYFPLSNFVDNIEGSTLLGKVLNFVDIAWTSFAVLSYTVSIILLFIYVYAATERKQLHTLRMEELKQKEKNYDEHFKSGPKNNRLADIEKHINSENPNDWKLAIIEADVMLDEALKKLGYNGISLGERLKNITPNQLASLDDAWQAHKIRNQIAHGGADFVLTKRIAEETIKNYRRTFSELGVI